MNFLTILYFSFKIVLRYSLSHASTLTGFAAPIFIRLYFLQIIGIRDISILLSYLKKAYAQGQMHIFLVLPYSSTQIHATEIRTCLWEGLCLPGPMISFLSTILLSNRQAIAQAQSICSEFRVAEPSWQHRAQQNAKQQQSILVDQFAHFQHCLSPICLDCMKANLEMFRDPKIYESSLILVVVESARSHG